MNIKGIQRNIKVIQKEYKVNIKRYKIDSQLMNQLLYYIKSQFGLKINVLFYIIRVIYEMKVLINKQKNKKPKSSSQNVTQITNVDSNNILCDRNEEQFIQISNSQAESYFEYLRKKIKSHNNDPFSLPFLNLKFEEIQSWKGATEQLNIQSTIYGMRVDSCHDSTMQMLNHVIRNQKNSDITNQRNVDKQIQQIKTKNTSQGPFHLENPNKLVAKIQTDKLLINRSLWSVIFKKSQSLQQIQLNKLQLSTQLSLNLDQNKISMVDAALNSENGKKSIQIKLQNINSKIEKTFSSNIIQNLNLFSEIDTFTKCLQGDIHNILSNVNPKTNKNIQIGRFQNHQIGRFENDSMGRFENHQMGRFHQITQQIQNNDMKNFMNSYYQINPTQNYKYLSNEVDFIQSNINHPFQYMSIKKQKQNDLSEYLEFNTNYRKMNNQFIQFQQIQIQNEHQIYNKHQLENEYQISELYEPQMDILFNSNFKKRKNKRINHNELDDNGIIHKKKIGNLEKVQFANFNIEHRQKCLFKTDQKDTSMRNNLLPINFVYLYENLNPFRKTIKKTQKMVSNNRFNYKNQDLSYEKQYFYSNKYSIQFQDSKQTTQFKDNTNFIESDSKYDFQRINQSKFSKLDDDGVIIYKNFPIKVIKKSIQQVLVTKKHKKNGIQSKQSSIASKQSKQLNETDGQEQERIGLNVLKDKMKFYDPLDILMSMVHLAYQKQINLSVDQVLTNNQINGVNIQSYVVNDIKFQV